MIVILLFLAGSAGRSEGTPEDFLHLLASSGADYWVDTRLGSTPDGDSIASFLNGVTAISVTPGRRVLENADDGYRVLFPESRWGFRKNGRLHSACDTTILEWTAQGFRWSRIPLFGGRIATLDRTRGVCSGVILTVLILGFAAVALGYVRHRYRE